MMISVRLDEADLIAGLEALGGKRSDHVRAALRAYVLGSGRPVEVQKPVVASGGRKVDVCEVEFSDEETERMDRLFGKQGKASFVQDAVKRSLGDKPSRWEAQKPVLLEIVGQRSMNVRAAARELGWAEGLVERVAQELDNDGLIRFERGTMVLA